MSKDSIVIPPELENMLLQFSINALVDNPEDLVSYAADYFVDLREKRKKEASEDGSQEDIVKRLGVRMRKRATVMGERFNPEEDDDTEVEVHPKSDEERERIVERTKGIFLFRILDKEDLGSVIDAMVPKVVEKEDLVIQQGEDGDYFYLIDNGEFDIYIKDEEGNENYIDSYRNEGFFGELALLHNQPRAATIKAASSGLLWAVGRSTFNKLIVKRAFEKRKIYASLIDETPQLESLNEYEKMKVADAFCSKSYNEGDIIVQEGDEGDGMYFIVEGRVSVSKKTEDGGEKDLGELEKGQFFGEMALVKHQPRAATVIAKEPTKTAFLDVKAFERLLGPCLDIMERHVAKYDK